MCANYPLINNQEETWGIMEITEKQHRGITKTMERQEGTINTR